MAMRARFPGRPRKNPESVAQSSYNGSPTSVPTVRHAISNGHSTKKNDEMDYGKIAAQTATNLKTFRLLFGTSDEDDEPFPGFRANGKLAKSVKEKQKGIKRQIKSLQNQLRHSYGRRSSAAVAQHAGFNGSEVPVLNVLTPVPPAKEKGFSGFSDDDSVVEILNKKRRLLSEQLNILSSETEGASTSKSCSDSETNSDDRATNKLSTSFPAYPSSECQIPSANFNLSEAMTLNSNGHPISTGMKSSTNDIRQRAEFRLQSHLNTDNLSNMLSDSESEYYRSEEPTHQNGPSKVPLAESGINFCKIKGARVKQVSHHSGMVFGLPRATLGDIKASNGQHNVSSLKDASQMPSTLLPGSLRSGKFIAPDEESFEAMEFEEDLEDFDEECAIMSTNANGEILLDRQGGHTRKMEKKRSLIKPVVPLDMDYIDSFGFPVVIDRNIGSLPPKPLCFLCGSAGLEQLIFCSSCCEPYHPYCTGDKSVLSLFVARTVPKSQSLSKSSHSAHNEVNASHVRNLTSLLSPPLTPPDPSQCSTDKIEDALIKKRDLEMLQQLREWTCQRCTNCQHCGLTQVMHNKTDEEDEDEFLKCWNCRLSFHMRCVSKRNLTKDVQGRWACGDCFKCKSCNKKVDFKTLEASRVVDGDGDQKENFGGKYLFCSQCIRKRQRGSFCPVCNVCYDDNDYDTRMMECGKCQRWIHGKCENMSEEQYQMLSGLPESVEYICRLCEVPGRSIWNKAIKLELRIGCEAVLRIFHKKALTTSRKANPSPVKQSIAVPDNLPTPPESSTGSIAPEDESVDTNQPDERTKPCTVNVRNFTRYPQTDEEKHYQQMFAHIVKNSEPVTQLVLIRELTPPESIKQTEPENQRDGELTRMKHSQISNVYSSGCTKYANSPSKYINAFIESYLDPHFSVRHFSSVSDLNKAAAEFLKNRFGSDQEKLESLQNHFASALEEVFPWFHSEAIKKSDLEMTVAALPEEEVADTTQLRIIPPRKWNPAWDHLTSQNPFVDTYWHESDSSDTRTCSLCNRVGDSPPDSCGRLLYAGLNEWLHVNCVLWSSEVWEGENGALQQVGQALARSKSLRCSICKKYGASISCCYHSCRSAYHFPCALNSTCYLMEDNSLFCPQHNKKARGEIQRDMEVMRRVFIDPEYIMKKEKEKLTWSADLCIFIGSLRIDSLGRVYPISASNNSTGDLTPVAYRCSRLLWPENEMFDKKVFSISTIIGSKRPTSFCLQAENIGNFVIDHSQDEWIVEKEMCQLNAFQEWIDTCPVYIDEYKSTWFPSCPYRQEDLDIDGNDADEEDNVQQEDIEIQTSFSECSTRGSSLSPGRSAIGEDEDINSDMFLDEIFTEYLPEDLNSIAEDLNEFLTGEAWRSTTFLVEDEHLNKMGEETSSFDHEFMQVDGACHFTSDSSEESSTSESEPEVVAGPSPSTKSESPNVTLDSVVRRGRSAAAQPTQGRLLRSREKQPQLRRKPEEHKCPKCKKTFQTSGSLTRHVRSCEPKKVKVKHGAKNPDNAKESRRERSPKCEPDEVDATPSTSKSAQAQMIARTARKQALMFVNESELSSEEEAGTKRVVTSPSKFLTNKLACHICHNIYRTEESLRKHLETCSSFSSSDGDDNFEEAELEHTIDSIDTIVATRQDVSSALPVAENFAEDKASSESEYETATDSEPEGEPVQPSHLGVLSFDPLPSGEMPIAQGEPEVNEPVNLEQIIAAEDDSHERISESGLLGTVGTSEQANTDVHVGPPQGVSQSQPLQMYSTPHLVGASYSIPLNSSTEPSSTAMQNSNLNSNSGNDPSGGVTPAMYLFNQPDSGAVATSIPSFVTEQAQAQQVGTNVNVQGQIYQYGERMPSAVVVPPPAAESQATESMVPYNQSSPQVQATINQQAMFFAHMAQAQQQQQQDRFMHEQQLVNSKQILLSNQNPPAQLQQGGWDRQTNVLQSSHYPHQQQQMRQDANFGVPFQLQPQQQPVPEAPSPQFQDVFVRDQDGNIRQMRIPVPTQHAPAPQIQQHPQAMVPRSQPEFVQGNAPIQRIGHHMPPIQEQGQMQSVHHMMQSERQYFVRADKHVQGSDAQHIPLQQQQQFIPQPNFGVPSLAGHARSNESCGTFQHQTPSGNVTYVVLRPDSSTPMQISQQEHTRGFLPQPLQHEPTPGWTQPQMTPPRPQMLMNPGASTIVQVLPPHPYGCSVANNSPVNMASQHLSCPVQGQSPNRNLGTHNHGCVSVNQGNQCTCFTCKDQKTAVASENAHAQYVPSSASQFIRERFPTCSAQEFAAQQKKIRKPRPQAGTQNPVNKPGQRVVIYRTRMTPPKILPATTAFPPTVSTARSVMSIAPSSSLTAGTSSSISGKTSTLNPNVAVVRPMEHPLMSIQKMSEKIEQVVPVPPPTIPFISPPPAQSEMLPISSSPEPVRVPEIKANEMSVMQSDSGQIPDSTTAATQAKSEQVTSTGNSEDSKTPLLPAAVLDVTEKAPANTAGSTTSAPTPAASANKAIKITLKRKEGGDSYSINSFSAPGSQMTGTMRSLKIKAKITSGEQAGTSTDVEVQPVVHTVPIPNESEENPTVCEDGKLQELSAPTSSRCMAVEKSIMPTKLEPKPERLTHKAVVVYRVKCNSELLFQSSDVHAVWSLIFEMVQGKRATKPLPPLSYPATNISLPDNQYQGKSSFNQLGLQHRAVQFLLEQLPGIKEAQGKQEFKFHDPSVKSGKDDEFLPESASGCARTEGFHSRKPLDMFAWLASKERRPLTDTAPVKSTDVIKVADLPLAMKFRNMKKTGSKHLQVYWSVIHGRGLFTTKDIECGEMIIEYAGELIRSSLCDKREKYYESRGIGCYMFRIDEDQYVVDATMKGNAARFINHSCDPNCRSRITEIFGKRRILIFALRKIQYGEELTYDYKFPYEEVKIPCSCATAKCKKFLN